MTQNQERICSGCGGIAHEVHIIDKDGARGDSELEYTVSLTRSVWTGKYPISGKVLAFMCEGCGQIVFYGKPAPAK